MEQLVACVTTPNQAGAPATEFISAKAAKTFGCLGRLEHFVPASTTSLFSVRFSDRNFSAFQ